MRPIIKFLLSVINLPFSIAAYPVAVITVVYKITFGFMWRKSQNIRYEMLLKLNDYIE